MKANKIPFNLHDQRVADAIAHAARAIQALSSTIGCDLTSASTQARLREALTNFRHAQQLVEHLKEDNHGQIVE
jgi:bacterioferritin-associated ferredoxin